MTDETETQEEQIRPPAMGLETSHRITLGQQRPSHTVIVVDEPGLATRAALASWEHQDAEIVRSMLRYARRIYSEVLEPGRTWEPPAWVRRGLFTDGWTAWRFDHLSRLVRLSDGGPLAPDETEEEPDGPGD